MQTSPRGVAFLVAHEGIVPGPYWDSASPPVLTWGIGHTAAAGAPIPAQMPPGMPGDLDAALREVFAVFRRDLAKYEAAVASAIGRTPCAQHQFDAAVSFHFKTGAIARAAWVDLWKSGRPDAAAASMLANWRRPSSIIGRRTAERDLFLTGDYGAERAAVWSVSASGKIGRAIRTMDQAEILSMLDPAPGPAKTRPVIRLDSRGADVRDAQGALGVIVDGVFGPRPAMASSLAKTPPPSCPTVSLAP